LNQDQDEKKGLVQVLVKQQLLFQHPLPQLNPTTPQSFFWYSQQRRVFSFTPVNADVSALFLAPILGCKKRKMMVALWSQLLQS